MNKQPLIIQQTTQTNVVSKQEAARLTVQKAKGLASLGFNTLKKVYTDGVDLVESNPYGLTKQEVIAALDADLVGGFAQYYALGQSAKASVNAAVPGTFVDPAPTPQA
jgi:hypothetical protein